MRVIAFASGIASARRVFGGTGIALFTGKVSGTFVLPCVDGMTCRRSVVLCLALGAVYSCCRTCPVTCRSAERSAGPEPVEVPAGVLYVPALQSVNDAARAKLAVFFFPPFTRTKASELFGESVICGPFLWSRVKDRVSMQLLEGEAVDVPLGAPDEGGEGAPAAVRGRVIRGSSDVGLFAEAVFDEMLPEEERTIRKPSSSQIAIYWSMVPYVIREPVFVVENGPFTFLVDLTQELEIGFIEELSMIETSGP